MPKAQIQPNVISYSAAISACEKGGQWQEALTLFEVMFKAKVQPNVFSYSAAISACEKGGQWQEALTLFDAMPKAQNQPNVISYNAAISACEKGGRWQEALTLFEVMSKAKVQPTVISYNAAISACKKGKQWPEALALFEGMSSVQIQPNLVSFNALFDNTIICVSEFASRMFQECDVPAICSLRRCEASEIDLHDLSEGMAELALRHWLSTAIAQTLKVNGRLTCTIVTGYGKSRKAWDCTDVRQRALDVLCNLELHASLFPKNPGRIRLVLNRKDLPKLKTIKQQRVKLSRLR